MAASRISVRVDEETRRRLTDEAESSGRRESDIIREALQHYLGRKRRRESAYEFAKKLKVIGCAKNLPPDLSTNKKYMEGFGK